MNWVYAKYSYFQIDLGVMTYLMKKNMRCTVAIMKGLKLNARKYPQSLDQNRTLVFHSLYKHLF